MPPSAAERLVVTSARWTAAMRRTMDQPSPLPVAARTQHAEEPFAQALLLLGR